MPSLKDALDTALPNYRPALAAPTVPSALPTYARQNQYLRCPLPPFGADTDSLRQFENGSSSPKTRVMPIPNRSTIGTTLIKSGGVVASSTGGGSNVSTPITLLPLSVFVTSSLLPAGSNYQTALSLSQSFQLISVSANAPCEVRLYGTALAQAFDASRPADVPVAAEIGQNIISCVNLDTAPFTWDWQNRIGANQDSPQGTNLYVTVLNTDQNLSEAVTVSIVYVPLET